MLISWASVVTVVTALAFAPNAVLAEELTLNAALTGGSDCSCVTSPTNAGTPIGSIISASDDTVYTSTEGLANASAGTPLRIGSEVTVGAGGFADISVGASCTLVIGPNSVASILQSAGPGGPICVKISSLYGAAQLADQGIPPVSSNGLTSLLLVGGAAAVGIAAGIEALGGGDDPASK